MKRTLIIPATIALLTGLSATAQEANSPDADVNASEAIIFSAERPELDELTIEELNALQLQALQQPVEYAENTETDELLFQTQDDMDAAADMETDADTAFMAETDTDMPASEDTEMMAETDTSETYSAETGQSVETDEWTSPPNEEMSAENEAQSETALSAEAEAYSDEIGGAAEADTTAMGGPDYSSETEAMTDTAMQGTIVDLAASDPRFTTLVSLVEQAGLTGTLNMEGPYTVFAPTNAAFEKLDPELLASLASGEANDQLTQILKGHVVEGEIMSRDITDGDTTVSTLADTDILVEKTEEGVSADQAAIIVADIDASNGVIHAVDEVFIPADTTPAVVEAEVDVDTSVTMEPSEDAMEWSEETPGQY